MDKTAFYFKCFDGGTSKAGQFFRHPVNRVIGQIQLLIDNIRNGRRPCGHGFKHRLTVRIGNCIIRENIAVDKLFHNIGNLRLIVKEIIKCCLIFQFEGVCCPYTNIRFHNDRITDLVKKCFCSLL